MHDIQQFFSAVMALVGKKVSNVFKYNAQVLHKPTFGFFVSLRSYPNINISLSTLQRGSMYLSALYSMTFQCTYGIGWKKVSIFLDIILRFYINLLLAFYFFEVLPKYNYKLIHTSKSFDVSFCILFNDFSVHLWHWLEKSVKYFRYNSQVLHQPSFGFFISLWSSPNINMSLSTLQRVSMHLSEDYSMTFHCSCGIGCKKV